MAGTTIEITNLQEYNASIERLQGMGARERDITAIFRNASKPLVRDMKARAGVSKKGVTSSRYQSRIHPPGTLKRSVKFVVSKRKKRVYYVLPHNKRPEPDVFYKLYYVGGTKHYRGKPFIQQAWDAQQAGLFQNIVNGIGQLEERLWQRNS